MINIAQSITIRDFERIVLNSEEIKLSKETYKTINDSFQFLEGFARNKIIYGVNTGFGPMAQYRMKDSRLSDLQYNIIRSHSSGMGNLFSPVMSRAVVLSRLMSFCQGKSAVSTDLITLLEQFLNHRISPCIYEHGSVGASGDLVQLAHLALSMIGEGEVIYDGMLTDSADLFKKLNISPLKIKGREGIALLNGTSAMTGVGLLNIIYSKRILEISLLFSCMANEIMEAYDDHISVELNDAKRHRGQKEIAKSARAIVADSSLLKSRDEELYKEVTETYINEKVQEYYSMRCYPQILGPVYDLLNSAEQILIEEVNSANDNPIVDAKAGSVFHGGNFHGDYVSLEMDKLKLAITRVTMLAERQLNYFLNSDLNKKLPPFINLCELGLNFGLQGMQFTATSTTAENQTLSTSMYIHSIPCNNDNQDIVSMGCNAAILAKKVIENAFDVLTIEAVALTQAVDYLGIADKLSSQTRNFYHEVRAITPAIGIDFPTYKMQKEIREYLYNKELKNIYTEV
jgi:histidine ammonia-lyase